MYWLKDFPLEIIRWSRKKKKQTNKYKEKFAILQSIGITVIKSKETSVITYTCRYSSGHLIPTIQSVVVAELGIKGPLEHLQAYDEDMAYGL